jgi:hypothetical protein
VAGKWDAYRDDAWDLKRAPLSPEARQFGVAGWVARLFSGMGELEVQSTAGTDSRYLSRAEAILSTLRALDASLDGPDEAASKLMSADAAQAASGQRPDIPALAVEDLS